MVGCIQFIVGFALSGFPFCIPFFLGTNFAFYGVIVASHYVPLQTNRRLLSRYSKINTRWLCNAIVPQDGAGTEVMGDTIINRGCLMQSLDEGKGRKFFHPAYAGFLSDMGCNLAIIKKRVKEKRMPLKPKIAVESRSI